MARRSRAAAFALLLAASPALAQPSAERQRELIDFVRQDCGACHGLTLKGGLGSPLLPQALAGRDKDGLIELILNGKPGTPMPPWKGLLNRAEVAWIVEYLMNGAPDAR
ncbi:MAG: cytochrome c [Rhodospirillales bacterium]|nr:cytochrome c [Rhodospirillales bacterium]